MQGGRVIVHGSSRDVTGQAMQGGSIMVRGTVGNRAAIQMREYEGHTPFLVVGETADDYLGEYMAGGVVVVLNLSDSPKPARNYIGTGMVGGRIYIRGRVNEQQVGLIPPREDLLRYLEAQCLDGSLPREVFERIASAGYPGVRLLSELLPEPMMTRVLLLFFSTKYTKPVNVEERRLSAEDLALIGPKLDEFFETFDIPSDTRRRVLDSEFTVIGVREVRREMPVPPQETPVEE
jgi:hypothetical protein